MHGGRKIALARKYLAPSLRQEDLAEHLGVPRPTIARWESTGQIPGKVIEPLSEILNVTPEWIMSGDDSLPFTARRIQESEPANIRPAIPDHELGRVGTLMTESLHVALPVWRGVLAGREQECAFSESDSPEFREIPGFYTNGHPEQHVLCIATGVSMSPRIEHADRVLVRLDPDVPVGCLVVARSPENQNFIKKLNRNDRRLELESLNDGYPTIRDLYGWQIKGGVVMINHNYEPGRPNIEWDEGRFLRA